MGIQFVYSPRVYWKMMAYQNVTPSDTLMLYKIDFQLKNFLYSSTLIGGSKAALGICSDSPFFISMQLSAKNLSNNGFSVQTQELAPSSGKSWLRH